MTPPPTITTSAVADAPVADAPVAILRIADAAAHFRDDRLGQLGHLAFARAVEALEQHAPESPHPEGDADPKERADRVDVLMRDHRPGWAGQVHQRVERCAHGRSRD